MEVSSQLSRPGDFTPRVGAPGTHWVGPRAVLDTVVKRKIPSTKHYKGYKNYADEKNEKCSTHVRDEK